MRFLGGVVVDVARPRLQELVDLGVIPFTAHDIMSASTSYCLDYQKPTYCSSWDEILMEIQPQSRRFIETAVFIESY